MSSSENSWSTMTRTFTPRLAALTSSSSRRQPASSSAKMNVCMSMLDARGTDEMDAQQQRIFAAIEQFGVVHGRILRRLAQRAVSEFAIWRRQRTGIGRVAGQTLILRGRRRRERARAWMRSTAHPSSNRAANRTIAPRRAMVMAESLFSRRRTAAIALCPTTRRAATACRIPRGEWRRTLPRRSRPSAVRRSRLRRWPDAPHG